MENHAIVFEVTEVGRRKKKLWNAPEEENDQLLKESGSKAGGLCLLCQL